MKLVSHRPHMCHFVFFTFLFGQCQSSKFVHLSLGKVWKIPEILKIVWSEQYNIPPPTPNQEKDETPAGFKTSSLLIQEPENWEN